MGNRRKYLNCKSHRRRHDHISDYIDPETKYPSEATSYTKVAQVTDVKTNVSEMPKSFELFQNYPNPFNPSTIINYQLPMNSIVTLKIYDVLGREVKTLVSGHEAAEIHQ